MKILSMIIFQTLGVNYGGILESFCQRETGVLCSPLYSLVTPSFAFVFYRVPVKASFFCAWTVEVLGWCEGIGGGGVDGVWSPPGALPVQFQPGTVFSLWELHADPMRRHLISPDAPICGPHQIDCNLTPDVTTCP